jgi:hypothetical protein
MIDDEERKKEIYINVCLGHVYKPQSVSYKKENGHKNDPLHPK